MPFPMSSEGRITTVLLIVFMIAMNPPVILLVDTPTLVAGINLLYLWTTVWGVFISLVFIWAARHDAFALSNEQVPPELRDTDSGITTRSSASEESMSGGQ